MPPILREAQLETVEAGPKVIGKMISELQLRNETGASIVGIDRQGESIVNPRPSEELEKGDRILLLGNSEQLESARKLLAAS